MKVKYIEKNYNISKKLKEVIEDKLEKFEKYFDKDVDVAVNCQEHGADNKMEVMINSRGLYFRSEVSSDNMYKNIDLALPKLEKQIIKSNEKFKSKMKRDSVGGKVFVEGSFSEDPKNLVKKKRFELTPMTLEEAEYRMEALGHSFYIFLNIYTNEVNVIYKRDDGKVGVIEAVY